MIPDTRLGPTPLDASLDLLNSQTLVVIGLIAHLAGSALQDHIAFTAHRLQQLGADILTVDANHYSAPAEYAGARLTFKSYLDKICIYHEGKLIVRNSRSYDRNKDIEDPYHPKELIAHRRKVREQKMFIRFLALSPRAQDYYRELEIKQLNPAHQIFLFSDNNISMIPNSY